MLFLRSACFPPWSRRRQRLLPPQAEGPTPALPQFAVLPQKPALNQQRARKARGRGKNQMSDVRVRGKERESCPAAASGQRVPREPGVWRPSLDRVVNREPKEAAPDGHSKCRSLDKAGFRGPSPTGSVRGRWPGLAQQPEKGRAVAPAVCPFRRAGLGFGVIQGMLFPGERREEQPPRASRGSHCARSCCNHGRAALRLWAPHRPHEWKGRGRAR